MKTNLNLILTFIIVVIALGSCRTAKVDQRAILKASDKLKMDIGRRDNHRLYTVSASWIGVPYRYGGNSRKGLDCSALAQRIYKDVYDKAIPRTTKGQLSKSRRVSKSRLKEGDLVFFSSKRSKKKVSHVGIYLKDRKFIHSSSSRGVIVSGLDEGYYRRYWLRGGRVR